MKTPCPRPHIIASCLAAILISGVSSAALDPQQFVLGWALELPSEEAFYDVPLTHEVYQSGRSLDELAVLDSNGTPMPFYRVAIPSPTVSEDSVTLGVSPIYVQKEGESVAGLSVTTEGDRTDVVVSRPPDQEPGAEIVAFVVDARDVIGTPTAIELAWRPMDRPFLMGVSIEHSDDLTVWRNVGRSAIASLEIEGASVTHSKIDIAGGQHGYYRIKWNRMVSDWQLETVVLTTSELTEIAPLKFVDLSPMNISAEDVQGNALYFDAGGALPTMGIDLVLPTINRWAKASIHLGSSIDGPWRQVSIWRLFYDIEFEGERLISEEFSLQRVEARYWKVLFDSKARTDGVLIRLKYPAEHLRFAANGEPPYQLVGGTLSEEAGPDATFSAVMGTLEPDGAKIATARLGDRAVLGGPAALEIPTEFPWKTVYLWLALLAAVLVISFMVMKLARDMSAESN